MKKNIIKFKKLSQLLLMTTLASGLNINHAYARDIRISSNQSTLEKQVVTNLANIAVNMRVKTPLVILQQNRSVTIQSQDQQGVKCKFKLNEAQAITSMQCN